MRVQIKLNETQAGLLDRVKGEGTYGTTREAVLRTTFREHVKYILAGGSPDDVGGWSGFELKKPRYGTPRLDIVLEPVTGKAVPVHRGEVLRIYQVEGGQCVDFNAYNLHDYKEFLDCGATRQRGNFTGQGTIMWTGAPRFRPMYVIVECAESCDQYYGGHRCNAVKQEMEIGLLDHPNCQDTFAEAIREYGLTPDDVHDSFNLWMPVSSDRDGRKRSHWNRGRKGDFVDLLAIFDTLAVPVICGGDLSPTNCYEPTPMGVKVFSASDSTLSAVDAVETKLSRYRSQRTPEGYKIKAVRTERELRPDPDYRPEYIPAPGKLTLEVDFSPEEREMLQGLLRTGVYGDSEARAALISFVRWYQVNRSTGRWTKLAIVEA